MRLYYLRSYLKAYKKLSGQQKERVNVALRKFVQNPKDKSLKNHALKGKMVGSRAISAAFDIRIVFREYDQYLEVLLVEVGAHAKVYK